jgi:hypothetical protein
MSAKYPGQIQSVLQGAEESPDGVLLEFLMQKILIHNEMSIILSYYSLG